jgi:hypothetical protein
MKICPNCQQHYEDDGLNFCLNDGGVLEKKDDDAPPPTMMMPQARQTNPNAGNDFTQPVSAWQKEPKPSTPWQSEPMPNAPPVSPWQSAPMQPSSPMSPQPNAPNYMSPPAFASGGIDQNLAIAAIICGSSAVLFSFCCGLFSLPLGVVAIITGFMGMNNANNNPQKYGGKSLAIGGMALGGISLLISVGMVLISFIFR